MVVVMPLCGTTRVRKTPLVVSPSTGLRTGLSNHERPPFDTLRVSGLPPGRALNFRLKGEGLGPGHTPLLHRVTPQYATCSLTAHFMDAL